MTNDSLKKATILMVGDDAGAAEKVTRLLETAGYDVERTDNLMQAQELARRITPDLVLMDLLTLDIPDVDNDQTSHGRTGFGDVPILFMTDSTEEKVLEKALSCGSDYVHKPIRRIELLTRVERILELAVARQQLAEGGALKDVLKTAGAVCHNLNQPLQYAMGATQILLMDLSPEDPKFDQLDAIRGKIEQMADITKKLADLTYYRMSPVGDK